MASLVETNLLCYENPGFERHDVAVVPYLDVGAAVGDITGNGQPDIVAGQGVGHNDVYWFETAGDPREPWTRHLLTDAFETYHDLEVADFSGNDWPDIYVAEMGLDKSDRPEHYLFLNQGDGEVEERTLATDIATHEAKATDLTGNGRPDVVGKSYGPDHHVDVWYNQG